MELLKKKQRYSAGATATAVEATPAPETAEVTLEDLQPETVQVISGATAQDLQLGGLRVSQARDLLGRALGIDRRAPALVNGLPADGCTTSE